jgi:hypothetical protein
MAAKSENRTTIVLIQVRRVWRQVRINLSIEVTQRRLVVNNNTHFCLTGRAAAHNYGNCGKRLND